MPACAGAANSDVASVAESSTATVRAIPTMWFECWVVKMAVWSCITGYRRTLLRPCALVNRANAPDLDCPLSEVLLPQTIEQDVSAVGLCPRPKHCVGAGGARQVMPARPATEVRVILECSARPAQMGLLEGRVVHEVEPWRKAVIQPDQYQTHGDIR